MKRPPNEERAQRAEEARAEREAKVEEGKRQRTEKEALARPSGRGTALLERGPSCRSLVAGAALDYFEMLRLMALLYGEQCGFTDCYACPRRTTQESQVTRCCMQRLKSSTVFRGASSPG